MTSAGNGAELIAQISSLIVRTFTSTAVSGSTEQGILDRITSNSSSLSPSSSIIWDGDPDGFSTVADYLSKIDQISGIVGIKNLIYIRPCTRGPSSDGSVTQMTLDMESIGVGILSKGIGTFDPVPIINTLNNGSTQDLLDIQARVICTSCLQIDDTHLVTAAKQLIGSTIAPLIVSRGM